MTRVPKLTILALVILYGFISMRMIVLESRVRAFADKIERAESLSAACADSSIANKKDIQNVANDLHQTIKNTQKLADASIQNSNAIINLVGVIQGRR